MIEFSINVANWDMVPRIEWGGELLFSWEQRDMKRTESSAPERTDKDANSPQWMTPQYSTTVGIVRSRTDRALVVSAMSGAVFQDNSLSPANRRYRRKRPYVLLLLLLLLLLSSSSSSLLLYHYIHQLKTWRTEATAPFGVVVEVLSW